MLHNNRQTEPQTANPKQYGLTHLVSEIQTAGYSAAIHGAKAALLLASIKKQVATQVPKATTQCSQPKRF